jgi:endonuclease G, mitochondrial
MLPQHPTNNRQGTAWARLENFSEDLVEETPGRELYIIAGGFGSLNPELEFNNPLRVAGINVPEETWKVIAILEPGQDLSDINSTQVIAVSIPNSGLVNIPDAPDVNFWPTHITTVREIELNTGLDLLSNLPDEIEEIIETTPYSGRTSI